MKHSIHEHVNVYQIQLFLFFLKKFHYVHAFNVFNDVLGVGLLQ